MRNIKLDIIKELYEKNKDSSESNIRQHVVVKFLSLLGYDKDNFEYEYSKYHRDGRVDIAAKISENNYLFVEVKKANNSLGKKEISQLSVYLTESGIEWGILTNGQKYILLNGEIKGIRNNQRDIQQDKIVLSVDIYNKNDYENFKYFSKEYLYDKSITTYFKHIAQFKAYKFPEETISWNVYKGTLYGFFKYYGEVQGKYRNLNRIRIDEFESYLKYDSELKNSNKTGKKITSLNTSKNKYSHLRSFFQTLNIKDSDFFDENKNELISRIEVDNNNDVIDGEILNSELISNVLRFYETRRDTIRNKVLFLLCLSFGFDRSTLVDLSFNDIRGGKLILNNRELVIPPKLLDLLIELKDLNRKFKVKENYLFIGKHNGEYKKLSEASINKIFDKIQEMNSHDESLRLLNPTFIRFNLIAQLFNNDVTIEEIVYLTGAELTTISKLISNDMIINQVKSRKVNIFKNHPFESFLY